MRFSYRIVRDTSGFLAECVESEVAGEGKTEAAAVASLRRALEERMFRPDAVAPPSRPTRGEIELVLADDSTDRRSLDLGGPGDAGPALR
jgi:hypothetical protein